MPLAPLLPSALFGALPLLKVMVQVDLRDSAVDDFYLGSAWRGLMGWEMRRLLCPFEGSKPCRECRIHDHCPYFLLFEQQSSLPGLRDAPKGYVLYPPRAPQNHRQTLWITLFGAAARFMPVVALALFNGQNSGLTKARHPYRITEWQLLTPAQGKITLPLNPAAAESLPSPPPMADWLAATPRLTPPTEIHLCTPLRLRKKGVYLTRMDGPFFLASLARRLEALHCLYHSGTPLGKTVWQDLEKMFQGAAPLAEHLKWDDFARYSSRQKKKVPMGGLTGIMTLNETDPQLQAWWQAAALVHVGKGVTLGLGKVVVENSE